MTDPVARPDLLDQLIGFLTDPDGELIAAAAIMLGRLRPVADRTLAALQETLASARPGARSYLLDALGATERPEALQAILPFLERPGSLAEQGVHLVRAFGDAGVEAVARRHEGVDGWISGAYVKAVAGIPGARSVDLLFDRLPRAEWAQARATTLCILQTAPSWPAAARARLLERMVATLADDRAAALAPQALVTTLNLASLFPEEVPIESVARWTTPEHPGTVRKHAISALGRLKPAAAERARLRERLYAYVEEDGLDAVVRPSLRVLEGWPEAEADPATLRRALKSRHHLVAEHAVRTLAAALGAGAAADLESALGSFHPGVRAAAAEALAADPAGRVRLLGLLANRDDHPARDQAARELMRADCALEESEIESLRETWVDTGPNETARANAILAVLCERDREGTNAWAGALATAAIRRGDPAQAIALIQPLVRNRWSDAENRFLLAMANLDLATDRPDLDDLFFRRGVDLIAPLCRTWGFDFGARLATWPALPARKLLALAMVLGRKGTAERAEAEKVRRLIHADELGPDDERDFYSLRDKLGRER